MHDESTHGPSGHGSSGYGSSGHGGYGRDRGGRGGGGGDRHDRHDRGDRGDRGDRRGRGLPLADLDPALTDVSRKLIGCAIEVHKGLGPGFSEDVYRSALEYELRQLGVGYAANVKIPVKYRGQDVGHAEADMVIDNRFIVDLMAHRGEIGGSERAALRALLRAADMELGLIINFAERRLKDGLVRVLNPDKLNLPRGGEGGAGPAAHDDDLHDDGGV